MKRYAYLVLVVMVPLFIIALMIAPGRASNLAAAGATEIGVAPIGQNSIEFVGRNEQVGGSFTGYGYLTYIKGLTETLLFSSTSPLLDNETNARFTYFATTTLIARSVISSVFVVDSVGTTVYYYHATPNNSFGDPASFATGIPVVTNTVHYQDILNVQAPNLGIATGFGDLTQVGVNSFTVGGVTYQLGHAGLLWRTTTTGEGTRTDPVTPKAFVVLAGNVVAAAIPGQPNFLPLTMRNYP